MTWAVESGYYDCSSWLPTPSASPAHPVNRACEHGPPESHALSVLALRTEYQRASAPLTRDLHGRRVPPAPRR